MKVKIDKDVLVDQLSLLPDIQYHIKPILNTVLFEASKNSLKLTVSDYNAERLALSTRTSVEAKVEEEGAICIHTKTFSDIIKQMPEGILSIETTKAQVKIQSGEISTRIKFYDVSDFPKFTSVDNLKTSLSINKKKLYENLRKASITTGTSVGFSLNAVLFELGLALNIVSTDGKKLMKIHHENQETFDSILVPNKTIKELLKIFKDEEGEAEISLEKNSKYLVFQYDNVELITMLVEGKYPDYKKVIPEEAKTKMLINREALLKAVKRANLISKSESNYPIKFELKKDTLIITTSNPTIGDMQETLSCSYKGKEVKIAFEACNILNILELFEDQDIEIEITGSEIPMVVRCDNFMYVALPVRT